MYDKIALTVLAIFIAGVFLDQSASMAGRGYKFAVYVALAIMIWIEFKDHHMIDILHHAIR